MNQELEIIDPRTMYHVPRTIRTGNMVTGGTTQQPTWQVKAQADREAGVDQSSFSPPTSLELAAGTRSSEQLINLFRWCIVKVLHSPPYFPSHQYRTSTIIICWLHMTGTMFVLYPYLPLFFQIKTLSLFKWVPDLHIFPQIKYLNL
jgi:hypothetical protein